ncbi:SAM-dependent methyltransferase [Streptomyces sp. NPDC059680]|uniref:SAM-dependent methyltransferase n=1 Tax=Streptomyces sp. NPDC059680 TaxID=3346904 RepID=UPI003679BA9C
MRLERDHVGHAGFPVVADGVGAVGDHASCTAVPQDRTAYVEAHVTDPGRLLNAVQMTKSLDFNRPNALSLNAVLHFVIEQVASVEEAGYLLLGTRLHRRAHLL